jgi:heptosyltransferase-2
VPQPIPQQIDDIVWLQTAFLGDIVLTTAAMKLVRRERPAVRQHLITTPIGAKALKESSLLNSVTEFDKRGQSFLASFCHVKSSIAKLKLAPKNTVLLLPHRSTRSSLLAWHLNIPTIAYRENSLSVVASIAMDRISVFHESIRIALLLEPLGFLREEIVKVTPFLDPLPWNSAHSWQKEILKTDKPLIAISPGSNWGTKRWPIESFVTLTREISRQKNVGFILLGSSPERQLTQKIMDAGIPAPMWNLAGETDLDDLRRIYPKLTLLICNDSSPIHYASAFNVPTLAIFGSTIPQLGFGPLAAGSRVAEQKNLDCRPCSDHGPDSCPLGHFACMRGLDPQEVAQFAIEMLEVSRR